jgi:hypothetical protein
MRYPEHEGQLKDVVGRYRTQSLFKEFRVKQSNRHRPPQPEDAALVALWTLGDDDFIKVPGSREKLPSLKALYLEMSDPTEYAFAIEAFGTWAQWLKIKNNKEIKKHLEDWPIELELKLRSEGIRQAVASAQGGNFQAAKFLAKKDWDAASKRGRPSKEDIERETKIAAKLHAEVGDDAARIGLKLVTASNS